MKTVDFVSELKNWKFVVDFVRNSKLKLFSVLPNSSLSCQHIPLSMLNDLMHKQLERIWLVEIDRHGNEKIDWRIEKISR